MEDSILRLEYCLNQLQVCKCNVCKFLMGLFFLMFFSFLFGTGNHVLLQEHYLTMPSSTTHPSGTHQKKVKDMTLENLGFIHIPKNGGSSIEKVAKELELPWGKRVRSHNEWKHNTTTVGGKHQSCYSKWHIPPRYLNDTVYTLKYNFCILRNPFTRLVSEFKFKQKHPYGQIDKKFKPFTTYFDYDADGLNEWIIRVFKRYRKRKWIFDCHLIPASEFIYDENGIRTCHFVLKLENLEEDFKKLKKLFNFEAELQHKKRSKVNTVDVSDFNSTSLEVIRRVYGDDFALYEDPKDFKFFDF